MNKEPVPSPKHRTDASERLVTEPAQHTNRSTESRSNSNRHLRCVAEVLKEREDQRKWMRNLKSKYLNDRTKLKPIYDRAEDIIHQKEYRLQQKLEHSKSKGQTDRSKMVGSKAQNVQAIYERESNGNHKEEMSPRSKKEPVMSTTTSSFNRTSNKKIGQADVAGAIEKHEIERLTNDPYARPKQGPPKMVIDTELQGLLRETSPLYMRPYHLNPEFSYTPRYYPRTNIEAELRRLQLSTYEKVPITSPSGLHRKYNYLDPSLEVSVSSTFARMSKTPKARGEHNPEQFWKAKDLSSPKNVPSVNQASPKRSNQPTESNTTPSHKPSQSAIRSMLEQNKNEILDFLSQFVYKHS